MTPTHNCHSTCAKRVSLTFKGRWSSNKPGCQYNVLFLNSWPVTQVWGRQQYWSDLVPTLSTKHISRFLRRLENQSIWLFFMLLQRKTVWRETIWCERLLIIGKVTVREACKCLAATSEQQSNYHANNRWHTSLWAGNIKGPKNAESWVTSYGIHTILHE